MENSVIDYIYETDQTIYDEVEKSKEYREASELVLKVYNKLKETLTDEQKEEFEKFIDNEGECETIKNRITFRCGVKYGVRIVAESMFDN